MVGKRKGGATFLDWAVGDCQWCDNTGVGGGPVGLPAFQLAVAGRYYPGNLGRVGDLFGGDHRDISVVRPLGSGDIDRSLSQFEKNWESWDWFSLLGSFLRVQNNRKEGGCDGYRVEEREGFLSGLGWRRVGRFVGVSDNRRCDPFALAAGSPTAARWHYPQQLVVGGNSVGGVFCCCAGGGPLVLAVSARYPALGEVGEGVRGAWLGSGVNLFW